VADLGEPLPAGTQRVSLAGLNAVFRMFRDSVALSILAVVYLGAMLFPLYESFGQIGFDFRGTIWGPARAVLDGHTMYPAPTRAAMEIGNPAVYPPFVPLLALPLALVPASLAAILWTLLLACCVAGALWLLGVRDWRCYVVGLTGAPVAQGLLFGNLTLLLVVPVAVAWRFRDRALIAGLAVGAAVATKLFLWPLIGWLLLTRRFAAAGWAMASATVLVLVPWAVVGFDGFLQYPDLLRALQNVYAVRSFSVATTAGAMGATVSAAVALSIVVGLGLLALGAWLTRRSDGDRRSFAAVVAACVLASPVVWPFYGAILLVPIAVMWRRLSPAWFFGYAVALVPLLPGLIPPEPEACCRPTEVPSVAWGVSHATAEPWAALSFSAVILAVTFLLTRSPRTARAALRDAVPHPRTAARESVQ
jgi:Glycosyltransferase family 87